MCHQTVGLVAGALERKGIPTASISMLREVTEKVGTPRALVVPFPLGYPLGRAGDAGLQARVIRAALALFAHPGPAPVLVDFAG